MERLGPSARVAQVVQAARMEQAAQAGRVIPEVPVVDDGGVREKRWVLPERERAGRVRLFAPTGSFERVTMRRDRTEARVLVCACSFLEEELQRMKEWLAANEASEASGKECVGLVAGRVEGVLKLLEGRYDSIEQVYVKSEEYAVAMGKFLAVSPKLVNRLAAEEDIASGARASDNRSGARASDSRSGSRASDSRSDARATHVRGSAGPSDIHGAARASDSRSGAGANDIRSGAGPSSRHSGAGPSNVRSGAGASDVQSDARESGEKMKTTP